MSRFDPKDLEIERLENTSANIICAYNGMSYINMIMKTALELIASNTEEYAQIIAQETLEAISVNKQ